MNVPIKLIKEFLTEAEARSMIDYVDHLEKTKPGRSRHGFDDPMMFIEFGKDVERPANVRDIEVDRHNARVLHGLDILDDQPKADIINYFSKVIAEIQKVFNDSDALYVNEFRIAKYYSGGAIELHSDNDEGFSSHLRYSAIIYLNDMTKGGGKISFVDHGYTYCPQRGDLLVFPCLDGGYHEVTEIFETRYTIALWCTDNAALALY